MLFSEELKLKFKNIINERCGLYFRDHDLKDLEKAISLRMNALSIDSAVSYYNLLLFSGRKEEEFRELLDLLTVNHTYFFRNQPQFKALKEVILPEIINRKLSQVTEKPVLRIWSAGCSTGEEPYTIAMIIAEVIPDLKEWDIQILATDASTKALDEAVKGVYGVNSMRLTPEIYRHRYFKIEQSKNSEKFKINDDLKQMVKFGYFNLMDQEYPGDYDIVFCRNVVIYFETETTIKVMQKIYESLNDQGYLFIGYSESLQFIADRFKMQDWQEAIYYRKYFAGEVAPKLATEELPEKIEFDQIIAQLSCSEVKADAQAGLPKEMPAGKIQEILVEIVKCMHLKKYSEALVLINEAVVLDKHNTEPYYLAAEIFMNQNKFAEAKHWLSLTVALNPLFPAAHYLFGCICIEEEKFEEAKESLKKALYLDKDFPLAHFYLGNIYKRQESVDSAIREYRNTLKGLLKNKLNDIIAYSGGFSVATLVSACRDNLERLKLAS